MATDLSKYADVHTHRLDAGDDAIINLPWGHDVPERGSFSVGIHPWDTATLGSEADIEQVRRLAALPQVVAIGEAGLDALRGAPLSEQERVFEAHVAISEAAGKPLIIHAVRTLHLILALHKRLRPTQTWIIHAFRGSAALAAQLAERGIHLSIPYGAPMPASVPPSLLHRETD